MTRLTLVVPLPRLPFVVSLALTVRLVAAAPPVSAPARVELAAHAAPEPPPPRPCPYCAGGAAAAGLRELRWHAHWARGGSAEVLVTVLSLAGAGAMSWAVPPRTAPAWSGPILVDASMRSALRLDSTSAEQRAARVSDVLLVSSVAHPLLVDTALVSWLGRESGDVALQLAVIDAQAYGLTLLANGVTKRLAGRERPWGQACTQGDASARCQGAERYVSFYSGHSALAATGAGLLCAHHTQLALYGSPAADAAACGLGIGTALATGALRMASDNHWASDVAVGYLLGFVSGYVVPMLAYYRAAPAAPKRPAAAGPANSAPRGGLRLAVFPMAVGGGIGLSGVGAF